MPTALDKCGGRKFTFSVFLVLDVTGLLIAHLLTETSFCALVGAVITGYLIANVAQKAVVKPPTT